MPNKKPAIAIGTIIILILIIWGTYSLFKPQIQDGDNLQTPQTQEEEEDEFADWEVYQNKEYGFKISYPKNYFYNYSISNDEFVLFDTEGVGTGLIIEIIEKSFEGRTVEIENWQSRGEKEFNNVIWNLFYKSGTEMVPGEWYKAIRQHKDENKLIEITLNRSTEELFNQILSTFKFID